MRLTPAEFEEEVAVVFTAMTKFKATRVGKPGDEGVDIELQTNKQALWSALFR